MKRLLSKIRNGRSSGARHALKRSLRPWHAGLVALPAILALTGGCLAAANTTLPATLASSNTASTTSLRDGHSSRDGHSWRDGRSWRWNRDETTPLRNHYHSAPKSPLPTSPVTAPTPAPVTTPAPAPAPVTTVAPEPATTPAPAPTGALAPVVTTLPTAATTGVPAGVTLSNMAGTTITVAGTVIDGKNITGNVTVAANNVTIRNSKINGLVSARGVSGLLLQRVEVAGPGGTAGAMDPAVGYSGFTCDGCNVHGWGKGFMLDGDVTITNSWVHDMPVSGDPANGGSHNEAILSLGGSNFTFVNNRLDAGSAGNFSASLALYNQWGSITNALIQGNLFNGGGYCVYAGYDVQGQNYPSNVRFVGNTFGSTVNPKCGYYGPAVAYYNGNGNAWTGNVTDKGATVSSPGYL